MKILSEEEQKSNKIDEISKIKIELFKEIHRLKTLCAEENKEINSLWFKFKKLFFTDTGYKYNYLIAYDTRIYNLYKIAECLEEYKCYIESL